MSEELGVAFDLFSGKNQDSDSLFQDQQSEDDGSGKNPDRGGDQKHPSSASAFVALIVVVSTMVAALWMTWVVGHVGDDTHTITGSELLLYRWFHLAIAFTILAIGIAEIAGSRRPGAGRAATLCVAASVIYFVTILFVESIGGLLPTAALPSTLRRLSFDFVAGPGLWLAAVSLAAGALFIGGRERWLYRVLERRFQGFSRWQVAGFVVIVGSTVTLAIVRYLPTAVAETTIETTYLRGPATPYFGQATLIAVWVLVGVVASFVARPTVTAVLISALAAVVLIVLSALVVTSVDLLAKVPLEQHLPDEVSSFAPSIEPGIGGWLVMTAGVTVGIGSALMLSGPGMAGRRRRKTRR